MTALAVRARLVDGVVLSRTSGGPILLVREDPLTVVEISPRGVRLLERLGDEPMTVAPADVRFLRRLADLGLVRLRPVPSEWPTVSVVVPVHGRPAQLAACLASLRALDYPRDRLEIVAVDDGSPAPAVVPAGVRLVRLARSRGPAAARNAGARRSTGEVLAFLDSDCTAEPGWLSSWVGDLAARGVAAAGGRLLAAPDRTWLGRYEAVRSPLDLGPRWALARPRRPVPYLVSASMVVRRPVFAALGGFDETLRWGEDVDLSWRLDAAGHRLVYQPEARARHEHRTGLRDFVRTRADYAGSEAALLARHPRAGRWLGLGPGLAAALSGGLGALLGRPRLAAAGALVLALETTAAAGRLRAVGLPPGRALAALARGQHAAAYHVARQLTRYYLAPAALLALAVGPRRRSRLLAGLAAAAALPAAAEWHRLGRPLPLPLFIAASLLDDLAYHRGLLAGCLREGSLRPLRLELRGPGR